MLNARQMGSRGGKSTLKKYGSKHFSRLAKRRWAKKSKRKPK